ncbi:MAG: futalosine hydrolase [Bacteroidales bacterium]
MKKILLVAATLGESKLLREAFSFQQAENQHILSYQENEYTLLHTGIGMVNTAYQLGKYLARNKVDFAVNFGIAGSFDKAFELGQVVEIVEDSFSEMGAEDKNSFLDLQMMGFPSISAPLHYNTFSNPSISTYPIPKTTAITVNTVHGETHAIEKCRTLWNKQLETMESAAFFQVMIMEKLPFLAVRSLSNYVEPRDKSRWKIGLAVQNINLFIMNMIKENSLAKG